MTDATQSRRQTVLRHMVAAARLDLTLGMRNVIRQSRRSGLGLFAVIMGVAALILAGGFFEWSYHAMREGMIRSRLGHAQVVTKGYYESGTADPFAFLMDGASQTLRALRSMPNVVAVAPRVEFGGLISKGEATISFMGQGVDPTAEERLAGAIHMVEGSALASSDGRSVVLGQGLAANLGAKVGDTVTLLVSTKTRGVNAVELRIAGIFVTSSKAYDDYALRLPLTTAQELLRVQAVHALVVLLDDIENTDRFIEQASALPVDSRLEVLPWYRLPEADFHRKTVELFSSQMNFLRILVAVIIVLSISNTLMSNVRERIGEIGTCMAMGDSRSTIRRRFVLEGAVLGATGGLAGTTLGILLGLIIDRIGIPMPPPPGMSVGFDAGIRLTPTVISGAFIIAVVTALLAAAYPAWNASRLPVVDALRHAR
jgi:putative ABC transport system permease protein